MLSVIFYIFFFRFRFQHGFEKTNSETSNSSHSLLVVVENLSSKMFEENEFRFFLFDVGTESMTPFSESAQVSSNSKSPQKVPILFTVSKMQILLVISISMDFESNNCSKTNVIHQGSWNRRFQ